MYEKRLRKLEVIDREIPQEVRAPLFGDEEGDVLIIGWGSTKYAALEAISELRRYGIRASYLSIKFFVPFPSNYVKSIIRKFSRYVFIEHSYLVQVGLVAKLFAGVEVRHVIAKYTGRPIYVHEIVHSIRKILKDRVDRVVLKYGA